MLKDGEPASDDLVDLDLRPSTPLAEMAAPVVVSERIDPVRPVRRRSAARQDTPDREPALEPDAPAIVATRPAPVRVQPAPTSELPLFVKGLVADERVDAPAEPSCQVFVADDAPLPIPALRLPVEPRAPLGVRRKAGDTPAPRPRPAPVAPALGPLDRDLLADLQRIESGLEQPSVNVPAAFHGSTVSDERVGPGKRAAAAALDAILMGSLATGVLAVTLRWCELPLERAMSLPVVPVFAFLLLVGLGYVLMFTAAGGQTIGKMAFGLRVIGDDDQDHGLTIRQAVYRSVLSLPSMLALGAGFVPALVGDERALHDRLAHTRVVRA